ncbi:MAG: hypothetical protein ACP5HQ_07145 [Thermoprotei archaeon]
MEAEKVTLSTGREVVLDESTIRVLNKYVRTQMTLEELARELGLASWEEAYELVLKVPGWKMWIPYVMQKHLA